VVVPVVRQGVLDWLANDEKAFGRAEQVAESTAEQLPGQTVETVAGEANVGLAMGCSCNVSGGRDRGCGPAY
jgi:hypothetical protein